MTFTLLKGKLAEGRPLFSPFFVLGDPTPELSVELCVAAVEAGASALELGLPFSDPTADGREVASAGLRAIEAGTTTDIALRCLNQIASRTSVPLNMLVYGNLVHARGDREFCASLATAGASSLLVPDFPFEESSPLVNSTTAAGIAHVALIGPSTSRERLAQIDETASGFLYLVSHQGITGTNGGMKWNSVEELIRLTVERSRHPICVGFGLKTRADLERVHCAGAQLAVFGSVFARVIREHHSASPKDLTLAVQALCKNILTPLTPIDPC